jgi:gliding motility-associated-like protein
MAFQHAHMVRMKKIISLLLLFGLTHPAKADHITGGQMFYVLAGESNGQYQYTVTLKLYMRCNSGRQFNNPTVVSIFDRISGVRVSDVSVALSSQENISLPQNSNPCISNPPFVCYDVGYYIFTISLPASTNGYVLASQVNYRIAGINNLSPGYGFIGATYTAEIPGTSGQASGPQNNSARFTGNDLVMVCADNPFSYSFAASDNDGDQLRYSFCGAYVSGSAGTVAAPPSPPFQYVPYGNGFFSGGPLGNDVHINPNTGLITGRAPTAGVYVVTVCVDEIRNGAVLATQRKDLQIFIAPCSIAAAALEPEYMLCRDTKTISLSNGSNSPLIHSYKWEFRNQAGTVLFAATTSSITYTFTDTGSYKVILYINPGDQCSDSTTSVVRVYPGFFPAFTVNGICFTKPTFFTDATTSVYGTVNSWTWDFGEGASDNDISFFRNTAYTYPTQGSKNVRLIATNSKGCRDTVTNTVSIVEKPPLNLAFRDTLICLHDILQLHANGSGIFNWSPNIAITNANTATPSVSPSATTTYVASLNDNGCLNRDSVKVRVVDHVNLQMMQDTLICQGDEVRLHIASNGLQYAWTPAAAFANASVPNAVCVTKTNTTYQVIATIGGCSVTGQVTVNTVPYPVALAGNDTLICYGTAARLRGQSDGASYHWLPSSSLSNGALLDPVASPLSTTTYILSAFNTLGCPKPGMDTVLVTVQPKINAFAGRDTSVVMGQPLQLNATGGTAYQWSPPAYLSSFSIADPVAVFGSESEDIRYRVLVFNDVCVDSAFILVKVFKTLPVVFVPTAFTPNNDGKNDVLRPLAAGIQSIRYFTVYNRWGQMVFTTSINGKGWDGKVNGRDQAADTFIWVVKAIDYKGKPYLEKGVVTLIR